MNENLDKIHKYLRKIGYGEHEIKNWDTTTVNLAFEIMEYAHRYQKRENGEEYANHPYRLYRRYQELVGIKPHECNCLDIDLMHEFNVPFDGVQEVCLLHDVVEDSEFSLEDVRNIYVECGFEKYFDLYIKNALRYITHDKLVDYDKYITICLRNSISSLVKMLDLEDNCRFLDLTEFNKEKYRGTQSYLSYAFSINNVYQFIENIEKYKKAFRKEKKYYSS